MIAFIEIDYSAQEHPFSHSMHIYSLTEGPFALDRDYDVFDALAGGREATMSAAGQDRDRTPLIAPRGIPNPQSLTVAQHHFCLVTESAALPDRHFWPASRCISSEVADDWLARGASASEVIQWFNCRPREIRWKVVSEPRFINASWLYADEYDKSLNHRSVSLESAPVEYTILRDAMARIEERMGQRRARLVVWFSSPQDSDQIAKS